jgi:hypothetical protein
VGKHGIFDGWVTTFDKLLDKDSPERKGRGGKLADQVYAGIAIEIRQVSLLGSFVDLVQIRGLD